MMDKDEGSTTNRKSEQKITISKTAVSPNTDEQVQSQPV